MRNEVKSALTIGNWQSAITICIMIGLVAGAVGAFSVAAAGFQSMAPTGQWFGQTFVGLPRGSKKLALTYDDGPNDPYTLRLLEVLARHGVKATFFMIGRYVQQHPEIAQEVARAGHVIGNHTFTHPNLILASALQTRVQFEQCEAALRVAVGQHSNLFRPPFGGRRPVTLRVARSLGLAPVMWNVTGWDWNAPSAEYIERRVRKQIRGGDVILLHDGGHQRMGVDRSNTVTATDNLLTNCRAESYEFVTVPEMMEESKSLAAA
jgi:peptidoglycan/xylan/chitin deacetylase (PgdA/CDA1 family)